MRRKKFEYIEYYEEKVVCDNGIELKVVREYGYDKDGLKYFINLREVMEIYRKCGIDKFRVVP